MYRTFPLVLSGFLLLLPGQASAAEHASAPDLLEPPEEHEEWQGSLGALWIQYLLSCAVWGGEEKRMFQCKQENNVVDLTISSQTNPLLHAQGMILGKAVDARAVKKVDILEISGTYDDQNFSLPLTIEGTAQDFTFRGIYNSTPFQGNGSYKSDSLRVSLSFMRNFPITGTLDLRRNGDSSSSSSGIIEFASSTGTGMTFTGTGMPPATSDSISEIPTLPLLSSGTIEGATQRVIDHVQDSGQTLMGFSRVLTLVFQTIFAVLVILVLITFGFLLHHLKSQQTKPPSSAPHSPQNNPPSKDSSLPHH